MFEMRVGDTFAVTESQRLALSLIQNLVQNLFRCIDQEGAKLAIFDIVPVVVFCKDGDALTMFRQDAEVTFEEHIFRRSSPDGEEIDDLDKKFRVAVTFP